MLGCVTSFPEKALTPGIYCWAKISAKNTPKLRLKRGYDESKQGIPYLIKFNLLLILFLYIMDTFKAKGEIPTPIEATESPSPLFKINYLVQLIQNITPGCHPIQSVKDFGSVVSLEYEGAWEINILRSNYGRLQIWIP